MTSQNRFENLKPAQKAGIMCNDPRFRKFAATRSGFPGEEFHASAAAEYLSDCCQITSRSELNTDPAALTLFNQLRTAFDAWSGRIARPR